MGVRSSNLDSRLAGLDEAAGALKLGAGERTTAIEKWRIEAAAVRFHLKHDGEEPSILAVIGGTGTGKSTLVNRLLQVDLSATSFRRTYTAGAIAIGGVPEGWLGVPHVTAQSQDLPARGQADALIIIAANHEPVGKITLIDTPDLDGDQPAHHAQADRVFRWTQALLFVVSPEKYQMTELLPYYRLARRYGVPTLFVMNKCETPEMLEDYRRLIENSGQMAVGSGQEKQISSDTNPADSSLPTAHSPLPTLFAVARDDAGYEPPAEANLAALRARIAGLQATSPEIQQRGLAIRVGDVLERLRDQIIGPLRSDRREIERMIQSLRALETPPPGIDVNPLTEQLQRRLQQRSVLYLMGPGRMLDRVRQVPGMLVRLPRTAWDMVIHGRTPSANPPGGPLGDAGQLPDFRAGLIDQFIIVQSRIDDILASTAAGNHWMTQAGDEYKTSKIDPQQAGKIADEELEDLKQWLQRRWNATPRDTLLLMRLLRHLPGGEKLTQWTEAAPYLLALVVATHHAIFGPVDLLVIGGFSLATWLTEKLSNEVAGRTRQTNRTIAQRFTRLAHEQIKNTVEWLQHRAPPAVDIDRLERAANQITETLQG